jgi:hypothetical protein
MKLYELTQEYISALDFLTDPENEVDNQTMLDTLEGLSGSLEDKMLNVARVIETIEAEALAIEAVEKRTKSRRIHMGNKAKWMRDYLISSMLETGLDKASDADITIKLARLPASVNVIDETLIPEEFWRVFTDKSINRSLIKENGGCPGATIESNGYRVSIK